MEPKEYISFDPKGWLIWSQYKEEVSIPFSGQHPPPPPLPGIAMLTTLAKHGTEGGQLEWVIHDHLWPKTLNCKMSQDLKQECLSTGIYSKWHMSYVTKHPGKWTDNEENTWVVSSTWPLFHPALFLVLSCSYCWSVPTQPAMRNVLKNEDDYIDCPTIIEKLLTFSKPLALLLLWSLLRLFQFLFPSSSRK